MESVKGYVYILTNPAWPEVKIGMTSKTPEERANELSSATGVRDPFEVYAALETVYYRGIEEIMHDHFREQRYRKNKEFFKISPAYALHQLLHYRDLFGGDIHLSPRAQAIVTSSNSSSNSNSISVPTSAHSRIRYSYDNTHYYNMSECFNKFIEDVLIKEKGYSFNDIHELFNTYFSSKPHRIITKKELDASCSSDLPKRYNRRFLVASGVEFYTSNQWEKDKGFPDFIDFANALGYSISQESTE